MKIIEITAKHLTLDAKVKGYAGEKVQKMIDYIPHKSRESAQASVKIDKVESKGGAKLECEILLTLPGRQLVAKESHDGVLAAIDGAEAKMRGQIRQYKIELERERSKGGLFGQLKRALKRK
ncbi:MAG: HPF/RaiA family ribosome-associated protein [Candidatus Nomurabacteria bacterium]|jgi:ribosomal subunit interface protein|nr:HPF/RaiA family ribosome-associated protein [Candidatus Nomurabacteria bacterium]